MEYAWRRLLGDIGLAQAQALRYKNITSGSACHRIESRIMKNRNTNSPRDSGNLSILIWEETPGATDFKKIEWRYSQTGRYYISDVGVSIQLYGGKQTKSRKKTCWCRSASPRRTSQRLAVKKLGLWSIKRCATFIPKGYQTLAGD